ncbi:Bifunctional purine biosynthetic protein ade1 [Recurvomyces mirabilis]|uniref:Phosphoribosylaminoimidazole-succinocarboxamide synthase n=1 Tax=Recurvomyces mirabilis TaxID=574656 RepID=A0AAE1C109_9PEZI|nr:Bifunctional purine biosynthetic protein ade1 [Recurvomyces mirabilis]KAK5154139.1 Bifunctional purine biosynthetic protein ade1 [Recurvomyces mirabilis]
MSSEAITTLDLSTSGMKHIASGKVREIYEVDQSTLLFVATDRISAYDVILNNGIPGKGALLTQLSAHWFDLIRSRIPNLKIHLISTSLPSTVPDDLKDKLADQTMQVRRYPILPIESIVRGYITGSAWSEYKKSGTVNGMTMPSGLKESQKLETAIWTPSTKAEAGQHDENISKERAGEIIGADVARKVEEVSLQLYEMARDYAAERGILIADTKFEFGFDPDTKGLVLVDEVLTPDSSRFWPADQYQVGKSQSSYDKQFLRDWLTSTGNKGKEGVSMPENIVQATSSKYAEAYEKLTGKKWT